MTSFGGIVIEKQFDTIIFRTPGDLRLAKENTTGKVRYEHVFAYFRKEFRSIGVKSEGAFRAAMLSRSKRISKAQRKSRIFRLNVPR